MKKFDILTVNSLEKVLPNKKPTLIEKENRCMRNETFSFQVAFINKSQELFFQFCSYEIKSELKEFLQVYSVENVKCSTPIRNEFDDYYLTKKVSVVPDILKEASPFNIHIQQWESLYIQIKGNLPIGSFPIEIILKDDNQNILGKCNYTLTIIDEQLVESDLNYSNWFHYDSLANYYQLEPFSKDYNIIMNKFIKNAVEHGMTTLLVPTFTPALDTSIGGERLTTQLVDVYKNVNNYSFNFDRLFSFLQNAKELGIKKFEIAHLFTQWGAEHAPKVMAFENNKLIKIFGWETDAMDEKYIKFLLQYLQELTGKLKEYHYGTNEVVFHISDEPNCNHLEHYLSLKKLIKPVLNDYLVCDALSNYEYFRLGAVERPVVATDFAQPFLDNHISNYYVYYCCAQCKDHLSNRFISMPLQRTRIIGIQLYRCHVKGLLQWGYNFYNSAFTRRYINPFEVNDADGCFQSGDAFIVYPSKDGTPYNSLRHEALFEGFQDYRALLTLERKIGREKVEEVLEDNGVMCNFKDYPCSAKWHIKFRNEIYDLILNSNKL